MIDASVRSAPYNFLDRTGQSRTGLIKQATPFNDLKRACVCGRFGAWLDRTRPSARLKSANIFVLAR